jgi:branched-chain amino acid transport system ATP-binding protein
LRYLRCVGPLTSARCKQLQHTFQVPVYASYGPVEALHHVCLSSAQARRSESVGKLDPSLALNVGEPPGDDQIRVSGPWVASSYHADAYATAADFHQGWFSTPDRGYLDADRYLHVTHGLRSVYDRFDVSIGLWDVASQLSSLPEIYEAFVFPRRLGCDDESLCAVIAPRQELALDLARVDAQLRAKLAPHKIPEYYAVIDALPRTPSGVTCARTIVAGDYEWLSVRDGEVVGSATLSVQTPDSESDTPFESSLYIWQCVSFRLNPRKTVALVVPEHVSVAEWARQRGLRVESKTREVQSAHPNVIALLASEVERINQQLSPDERIQAIVIEPEELTRQNGMLSDTLSLRADVVKRYYSRLLEQVRDAPELSGVRAWHIQQLRSALAARDRASLAADRRTDSGSQPVLLTVYGLTATDPRTSSTLENIELIVPAGTIHVVMGASWSAKTLLLKAIAGLVERQAVILARGIRVDTFDAAEVAHMGIMCAIAETGNFGALTVAENLIVSATRRPLTMADDLRLVYRAIPELHQQRKVLARALDRFTQRLLVLGRALMMGARIVLFDDPTLLLSDAESQRVLGLLRELRDRLRMSFLLTVSKPLPDHTADRLYALCRGRLFTLPDQPAPRDPSPLDSSGVCKSRPRPTALERSVVLPDIRRAL